MVPRAEHAEDGLAGRDDRVDPGRPLGRVGDVAQPLELVADQLPAALPLGGDQRRVEAGVADPPGQPADDRVAQLGGPHQLVDGPQVRLAVRRRQRVRVAQPPLQQLQQHRHLAAGPPVGQEHPVERAVQLGAVQPGLGPLARRLQLGHAVVPQRAAQPDPERLGQPLRGGVPGAQVRVEVLLRVAGLLAGRVDLLGLVPGLDGVGAAPVAVERAEVGEDLQHGDLAGQHARVVRRQLVAGGGQRGQQRAGLRARRCRSPAPGSAAR